MLSRASASRRIGRALWGLALIVAAGILAIPYVLAFVTGTAVAILLYLWAAIRAGYKDGRRRWENRR